MDYLTSEPAYQALYDALLDQAGVEPGPLGKLKPKQRQRDRPLDFGDAEEPGGRAEVPRIDLTHLPTGAEHFLGRQAELAALDAACADSGQAAKVYIVELIAPGGTGKTALVKRWLDGLRAAGWSGGQWDAKRVFGWSFYSQGTGEDRQASEDHFLASALKWFGVEIDPATNPVDKGRALAQAVAKDCTLLVLDGIEPLQYPPGPLAGELRAPGLKALLTHLAGAGQPGLCVVTSREWLQDLAKWVQRAGHPHGAVLRLDLGNLSDSDGAELLHALGANRAGASEIGATDPELIAASQEVQGHALTLSLLGNYLRLAYAGDIRRRDLVDLRDADAQTGGRAFRVMAAYVHWLAGAGEWGARGLAVLRLLGLFDRPASAANIAALRAAPPIPGLTEALFKPSAGEPAPQDATAEPLPTAQWNIALKRLAEAGLIAPPDADGCLDAHPLVREYLAATLKQASPAAWREGHRRLYERLKASVPHHPEGLDGLQPLYQAVATAAWRGCGRRSATRSISTASCAGRGTTASTAGRSSVPSVPTWGPSPASSPSPGGARPRPWRRATRHGCSTRRPSACAPWAGWGRPWSPCGPGRRCG